MVYSSRENERQEFRQSVQEYQKAIEAAVRKKRAERRQRHEKAPCWPKALGKGFDSKALIATVTY
jgi:hypothetical protein